MDAIAKLLVICGVGLVALGGIVWVLGRVGFRGLPGDISYRGEHVSFYFPIVTCLVLSALLTLGMWLWHWLSGR